VKKVGGGRKAPVGSMGAGKHSRKLGVSHRNIKSREKEPARDSGGRSSGHDSSLRSIEGPTEGKETNRVPTSSNTASVRSLIVFHFRAVKEIGKGPLGLN